MVKAYIDLRKGVINIDQNFGDMKEVTDTISVILERLIIDNYLKPSPKLMAAPINEQKEILLKTKRELIKEINDHDFDYEYINSEETSSIYERDDYYCEND